MNNLEKAKSLLQEGGIAVSWDSLVDYIRNRSGDDRCPVEQATENIDDPQKALVAIQKKLKELQ